MKITKRQLRKLIREAFYGDEWDDTGPTKKDSKRPWGSYAEKSGNSYTDVITMSPNGDSVLVDGMETYITDVPDQLEHASGHSMNDTDADNLIFALEDQMSSGYVELSVEYENGKWSW